MPTRKAARSRCSARVRISPIVDSCCKNHYGSRSQRGTEIAALFYSLIESAKLAGVGPHTYLRAATTAVLRGEPIVLPHQLA
jgi:hypothetical protein